MVFDLRCTRCRPIPYYWLTIRHFSGTSQSKSYAKGVLNNTVAYTDSEGTTFNRELSDYMFGPADATKEEQTASRDIDSAKIQYVNYTSKSDKKNGNGIAEPPEKGVISLRLYGSHLQLKM